ncbi:hypothetical protein KM043_017016 [Ampulex compressa]|nr:hypothetical protein KM043_017016 [Ampulex compressa]
MQRPSCCDGPLPACRFASGRCALFSSRTSNASFKSKARPLPAFGLPQADTKLNSLGSYAEADPIFPILDQRSFEGAIVRGSYLYEA